MPLRHELHLNHDEVRHGPWEPHAFVLRPDGIPVHSSRGKLRANIAVDQISHPTSWIGRIVSFTETLLLHTS